MTEPPKPPETRAWQPTPPGQTNAWQPPPPHAGQPPHPSGPGASGPQQGYSPQPGPPPSWEPTTTITPPAKGRGPGGKKTRTAFLAVLGVVVLAVLVTGFWKPGFLRKSELDVHAAEDGVRQVLTDPATGYGATDVTDVRCNDGHNPVIKAGDTFTCEATIAGAKRTVEVTFADSEGSYWVGSPS